MHGGGAQSGCGPYEVSQLVPLLQSLSHLHLQAASVTFIHSSIVCLSGLKSLCINDCTIVADWDNLSKLTNLTLLDLGHCSCFNAVHAWTNLPHFAAWSELRTLKFVQCTLFDEQTLFRIPAVVEVHASHVLSSLPDHQLCLHAEWCTLEVVEDYCRAAPCISVGNCLVKLQIKLLETHIGSLVAQLIHCQKLQVLHIKVYECVDGAVSVVLDQCGLTELCLEGMDCEMLDLARTTSLTSLQLLQFAFPDRGEDQTRACLPHALKSLRVTSDSLLQQPHWLRLEHCTQLTRLEMWSRPDIDGPNTLCRPFRPSLPSSLKRLAVQVHSYSHWCDFFDWHFLDVCINLQRLTLPDRERLTLRGAMQLQAWLTAARHLHILDFFPVDRFMEVTDWANSD